MAKKLLTNTVDGWHINSIEEGIKQILDIDAEMAEIMHKMNFYTGQVWDQLCDDHYELTKRKKHIKQAMAKLAEMDMPQSCSHAYTDIEDIGAEYCYECGKYLSLEDKETMNQYGVIQ